MGFWNNVGTWFTGRNGVYKDDALVDQAKADLNEISNDISTELDEPLNKAIADLNGVKGMSEYVGTLSQGAFDEITASAQDGIDFMIAQIQAKQDEMNEYEKGNLLEKGLGTISMASGKIIDGFASVFEGIGDAALTVTNWVSSGVVAAVTDKKFNEVANNSIWKKAIEFDVSGTIAKPLTDNPLAAKYSFFTKDSGAASICKGIGKTAGYMLLGGQIAGACRGASGGTAMAANLEAKGLTGLMQSTTYATSAVAGVSGFGQGTETGLRSGKSFQKANLQGLAEGAVEAGSMYVAGKLGEKAQISKAGKAYKAEISKLNEGAQKAAMTRFDKQMGEIATQVHANGGFTNAITEHGLKSGFNAQQAFSSAEGNVLTKVGAGAKSLAKDSVIKQKLTDNFHKTTFEDADGNKLKGEALKEAKKAAKAGTDLPDGVEATKTFAPVRGVAKTAVDIGKTPYTVTKSVIAGGTTEGMGTTITKASGAVWTQAAPAITGNVLALGSEVALGGETNAIDRATGLGINSDTASQQFQLRQQADEALEDIEPLKDWKNTGDDDTGTDPGPDPDPKQDEQDKGNDPDPNPDNPGGGGGNPGGGGGNPGGGSETQFRNPELTNASNTSATNTTTNTAETNTAANEPNTAANIVFQNNSATNTPEPNTAVNESNTAEPPTGSNGSSEIVTPADPGTDPDNPTPGATVPAPSGGGTSHQGGGYTGEAGYTNPDDIPPESVEEIVEPDEIDPEYEDVSDSISSIIDGTRSNFTKLPTTNSAIHSSSSGSAVIPVIAGLSAAAAAGIGAKAYMDRKNNNDNGDDDFEAEEWTGEDNLDMEYNDGVEGEQYLDDESDYGSEIAEPDKYGARSNDELADMQ